MPFRLRDNSKLLPPPRCEEYIGEPLDENITLLENKFKYDLLKDAQGKSDYRLITMKRLCHIIEILAYKPENSDTWIIVDAFPPHEDRQISP